MWIVLGVAWVAAMWVGFVLVLPVVFPLTLAVTTIAAVGGYFYGAGRVLLPATTGGLSPVTTPEPGSGRDPAYRHYLLTQVWKDWRQIFRTAVPLVVNRAGKVLTGVTAATMSGWQGLFLFPGWLAICGGVVLAAVPLVVMGVLIAVVYGVTVLAGLLLWLAGVGVLRGLDQLFSLARRILQACPHPGCYSRFALPVYACPTCQARHRDLTPNLDGALRHVCRCGTRLPTAVVLGRFRLPAHCPQCERPLPTRIGRARVEPLPLVGGPDSGKSTFMALAIDALHGAVHASGGRTAFSDEGDQSAFARMSRELAQGRVAKTGTELPKAVVLDLALSRGHRILYLFDPSGEHYTGASKVEAMTYLEHGDALVLIVDPFALPDVQRDLLRAERDRLAAEGVVLSREDPDDTYSRVRNELAGRADGGRQKRIAVVLTKGDLLRATAVGQGAAEDPAGWLARVGKGNLVRALSDWSGDVRYFVSSLPADPARIAGLFGWLAGVKVNGPAGATLRAAPQAGDLRKPWAARRRDTGLVPLSYQGARWGILLASALLSCAATVLLVLTLVRVFAGDGGPTWPFGLL